MLTPCSSACRKWWHFVPSLSVWAAITWLSLIKAVPVPLMGDIPLADKWGHMLAYLVFALCLAGDGYRARLSVRTLYDVVRLNEFTVFNLGNDHLCDTVAFSDLICSVNTALLLYRQRF